MTLELHILLTLRDASPNLMPKSILVSELRMRGCKESLAEISTTLESLERRDEVMATTNPDTGSKWKLAEHGKVRLIEAGL